MVNCQVKKAENTTYPKYCWGTGNARNCSISHDFNWSNIINLRERQSISWTLGDGVFYSFPNTSWINHTSNNTSLYFSLLYPLNSSSFQHLQSSVSPLEASKSFLMHFNQLYQQYHGYASFLVCLFGIAANLINITVLTRRNMTSPTNFILTALAVSDLMTMISYLPYAVYFHFVSAPDKSLIHPEGFECICFIPSTFSSSGASQHPKRWVVYMLFHTLFIITTHTISMWLTVTLALFRYVVVCHPIHGPGMCSLVRAKQSIVVIFFITIISCSPNYIMYHTCQQSNGGYWFETNYFVVEAHKIFNFWMFGVVLKVVPCLLLTVLSGLLLRAMAAQNAKRKLLLQKKTRVSISKATGNFIKSSDITTKDKSDLGMLAIESQPQAASRTGSESMEASPQPPQPQIEQRETRLNVNNEASMVEKTQNQSSCNPEDDAKCLKSSRRTKDPPGGQRKFFQSSAAQERDRTTCMLVVVVLCFVIIELPQGILALLSAVDNKIFDEVYVPLGDFLDILVLINSSMNFILYCSMSAKFRSTFKEIFLRRWMKR